MVLCFGPCCYCSYSRLASSTVMLKVARLPVPKTDWLRRCAGAYCCCNAVYSSSVFVVNAAICPRSSLSSWQVGDGAAWICSVCTPTSLSSRIQRSASERACRKVTRSPSLTNRQMSRRNDRDCNPSTKRSRSISSFTVPASLTFMLSITRLWAYSTTRS